MSDLHYSESEYEKNHENITSFVQMEEEEKMSVVSPHFSSVKVDSCTDKYHTVPLWMLEESMAKLMGVFESFPGDIKSLKLELTRLIQDGELRLTDLSKVVQALEEKSASKAELQKMYEELSTDLSLQDKTLSLHTSELNELRKLVVDEAILRETVDNNLRTVLEEKLQQLFEKAENNELNDEKTRMEILASVKEDLNSTTTNLRETLKETIQADILEAVRKYDEQESLEDKVERERALLSEKEIRDSLSAEIESRIEGDSKQSAELVALREDLAKQVSLYELSDQELQKQLEKESEKRSYDVELLSQKIKVVSDEVTLESKNRSLVDGALRLELMGLGKTLGDEFTKRDEKTNLRLDSEQERLTSVHAELSDSFRVVSKDLLVEKQERISGDEDLLVRLTAERERLATVQAQLSSTELAMKKLSETLTIQESELKSLIEKYDSRFSDDNAFQLNKYWRFVTKGPQHQTLSIQYRKSVSDKWSFTSPFFNI